MSSTEAPTAAASLLSSALSETDTGAALVTASHDKDAHDDHTGDTTVTELLTLVEPEGIPSAPQRLQHLPMSITAQHVQEKQSEQHNQQRYKRRAQTIHQDANRLQGPEAHPHPHPSF